MTTVKVDNSTNDVNNVAEQPEVNEIDYKKWYEENHEKIKSFDSVVAKKDQLLKETKKAKEDREAANAEAARIAEEKAKQDGEFENLWRTAKEREENLAKQLQEIKNAQRQDKIENAALNIASKLAEGDNVELLGDFIGRTLSKLTDEAGALSADVLKEVQQDFANNPKYKSLLKGSKAVGGSAPGSTSTVSEKQDLSKLSPVDRINAVRAGQK